MWPLTDYTQNKTLRGKINFYKCKYMTMPSDRFLASLASAVRWARGRSTEAKKPESLLSLPMAGIFESLDCKVGSVAKLSTFLCSISPANAVALTVWLNERQTYQSSTVTPKSTSNFCVD